MKRLGRYCMICIGIGYAFLSGAAERDDHALDRLHKKQSLEFRQTKNRAWDLAQKKGFVSRARLSDGRTIELMAVDPEPLYYISTNHTSARTLSTSFLHPNGGTGLDLMGKGVPMAMWDVGGVGGEHPEFGGRIQQIDHYTGLSAHSTQVAGTLIAAGLEPNARGMAPEASLQAYEWNNDSAEMAKAAAGGVILSNHSYGSLAGWVWNYRNDNRWAWFGNTEIDSAEDYHFGYYNYYAHDWDEIAYNAPHMLIVKAAGNDRYDSGPAAGTDYWVWDRLDMNWKLSAEPRNPDGDYDTLVGPSLCKNVLTVGAVKDIIGSYSQPRDVQMTPFSAWGPADDGRIKPDVVANGSSLYSPTWNDQTLYSYYSGTSAASPSVCGSLALVQEYFNRLYDRYLKAATLKALVIHTADEAGSDEGPDYQFGWGLMNTRRLINLIRKNDLEEQVIYKESLGEKESFSFRAYSDGQRPIVLTLAWTDPAPLSLPPIKLDSRASVLVNDLDIQCTREKDGHVIYPWSLNPAQPREAAVRTPNHVDNVEQIRWQPRSPGYYRVTVSHTGDLRNTQAFALIVSGLSQQIYVKSRILLQGPYDASQATMSQMLQDQEVLPARSPFQALTVPGFPDSTTDWMSLELRETPFGEPVSTKSVLLKSDGTICDPLSHENIVELKGLEGDYFLALIHRNHLTAISRDPLPFRQNQVVDYDFSVAAERFFNASSAIKISDDRWAVRSGDGDSSQGIWIEDYQLYKLNKGENGYQAADYDLSGQVDEQDLRLYFRNQGKENKRVKE